MQFFLTMDPTLLTCLIVKFGTKIIDDIALNMPNIVYNGYKPPARIFDNDELKFVVDKVKSNTKVELVKGVNRSLYNDLIKQKKLYEKGNYAQLLRDFRDHPAVNPFSELPRLYTVRSGLKLANIDGILTFIPTIDSNKYEDAKDMEAFSTPGIYHLDMGGAPGGFIDYVNDRSGGSTCVSFSLNSSKDKEALKWNDKLLERMGTNLEIDNGKDDTGNIYTNWDYWGKKYGNDFDVATGDIGFRTEDWERKEILMQKIILHELWVGTKCLAKGGNLIVKTMDFITKGSIQMLEMISRCYDTMYVMKPVTSRPTNEEKYVIFMGKRSTDIVDPILNRMIALIKLLESKDLMYIKSLRTSQSEQNQDYVNFANWINQMSNYFIKDEYDHTRILVEAFEQYKTSTEINKHFNKLIQNNLVPQYDLNKVLTSWRVEDFLGDMIDSENC